MRNPPSLLKTCGDLVGNIGIHRKRCSGNAQGDGQGKCPADGADQDVKNAAQDQRVQRSEDGVQGAHTAGTSDHVDGCGKQDTAPGDDHGLGSGKVGGEGSEQAQQDRRSDDGANGANGSSASIGRVAW